MGIDEITLRRKLVGLQLQAARLEAGVSVETCASWLGVSPETLGAWESGRDPVPLSVALRLARRLELPLTAFEDGPSSDDRSADGASLSALVGARLRHFREAAGLSPEALAADVGLSPEELLAAEEGEVELDMATLVTLTKRLQVSLEDVVVPVPPEPADNSANLPPELAEWLAAEEHQELVRLLQATVAQPVEAITAVGRLLVEVAMVRAQEERKGA